LLFRAHPKSHDYVDIQRKLAEISLGGKYSNKVIYKYFHSMRKTIWPPTGAQD